MMQPAVSDEKHLTPRNLFVDHFAYVETRLADEISAELEAKLCVRKRIREVGDDLGEVSRDGTQVQTSFARKVRDSEAPTEVQQADRCRRFTSQFDGECRRLSLRVDQCVGTQVL